MDPFDFLAQRYMQRAGLLPSDLIALSTYGKAPSRYDPEMDLFWEVAPLPKNAGDVRELVRLMWRE